MGQARGGCNPRQYRLQPLLDFLILETQDEQALFLKLLVAVLVVGLLLTIAVYGTIQLDHEPMLHAIEVDNVAVERLLPPKLEPVQPPVAQTCPQSLLRGRAHSAELA